MQYSASWYGSSADPVVKSGDIAREYSKFRLLNPTIFRGHGNDGPVNIQTDVGVGEI